MKGSPVSSILRKAPLRLSAALGLIAGSLGLWSAAPGGAQLPSGTCTPSSSTTSGSNTVVTLSSGSCIWTVPQGVTSLSLLIVGGGGGGGSADITAPDGAGGGGGGGFAMTQSLSVFKGNALSITVGGGGSGATTGDSDGASGDASSITFLSTPYVADGGTGGGGGTGTGGPTTLSGDGGASGNVVDGVATPQSGGGNDWDGGGGGGGAGSPGDDGVDIGGYGGSGGNGGTGLANSITGVSTPYGCGGGGGGSSDLNGSPLLDASGTILGSYPWSDITGTGGTGGCSSGGDATQLDPTGTAATPGADGFGGGGGGGGLVPCEDLISSTTETCSSPNPTFSTQIRGADGGTGVVIISYATPAAIPTTTEPQSQLASTGSDLTIPAGVALALLGAGATAAFVSRRRRAA